MKKKHNTSILKKKRDISNRGHKFQQVIRKIRKKAAVEERSNNLFCL